MSPTLEQPPAHELREVSHALRAQWSSFLGTQARIFRWCHDPAEKPWLDAFLRTRLEGSSRAFKIEAPFDARVGSYGQSAALDALPRLAKSRVAGRAWQCPPIQGARDPEIVARIFLSLAQFLAPTGADRIALVLDPSSVSDVERWHRWIVDLASVIDSRVLRVVLLEDRGSRLYERLAMAFPAHVTTCRAGLEIQERIVRMTERLREADQPATHVRALFAKILREVDAGRTTSAAAIADDLERCASAANLHAIVIPARFAVGAALMNESRPAEAVRAYSLAVRAAEHAESMGHENGRWLRIMARFGVGAALLAAPSGAVKAATYFGETAPLCLTPLRRDLELEAYRCASAAYEVAGGLERAWDAGVRALGTVDQLEPQQRKESSLVAIVDALLRLTETRALGHYRAQLERELRKRALRGSTWA